MAERSRRHRDLAGGTPDPPSRVLVHAVRFERTHRHCAGLLDRGFEVHFVAEAAKLLELVPDPSFRAVVAYLPIPRPTLDGLLAPFQTTSGRSPRPNLVLLVSRATLPRVRELLARGASRVLADTTSPRALAEVVANLPRRSPRAAVRLPARLEALVQSRLGGLDTTAQSVV